MLLLTSLEQWKEWRRSDQEYTMLPFITEHSLKEGEDRPVTWRKAWEQARQGSFVLESGKGGRYTFLGLEAAAAIRGKGSEAWLEPEPGSGHTVGAGPAGPLEQVKRWFEPFRAPTVPGAPKWTGGCVGFWGYDVVRSLEKLPHEAKDDLPLPDYAFVRVDRLWIVDHVELKLYCAVHCPVPPWEESDELAQLYEDARRQAERMKNVWNTIISVNAEPQALEDRAEKLRCMEEDRLHVDVENMPGVQADFPKESFIAAVQRIQHYIGAGDVFQVNLSVRQHKKLETEPDNIYEWLRVVNPSPYMGMLRFDGFQLVSGSPELLVRLEHGMVSTRPIAGTRPRGRTPEEDRRLAEELLGHEKERAEHIMLVDLERNDLGKISEYGTVKVSELMVLEYYSHVMHIVSQVEGKLAQGRDAFDVIAATFPGGTITGAPKIRTMQIIEELEPVRRGPYTGSIGWIGYNGDTEFNIAIRTLVAAEGIGYVQAGAGIVIDSVPHKEYTESLNKAKALWKAIQYSERLTARLGEVHPS